MIIKRVDPLVLFFLTPFSLLFPVPQNKVNIYKQQ